VTAPPRTGAGLGARLPAREQHPLRHFREALAPAVRDLEHHRPEVLTRGWSRKLAPGGHPPREDSSAFGHKLGLGWADAAEALDAWRS